jgi:4-diphosphocytidyl-2-C-methyl-D-erythritol kinase
MSQIVRVYPNAKINLGLYVMSKRNDGYHEILTCMLAIDWTDVLSYSPSEVFDFHSKGRAIPNDGKPNLCERAFWMMKSRYPIPNISLELEKSLPIGGGLGGGSSDAAFLLKSLSENYVGLSVEQLKLMAAELGSDCSFFIEGQAQIARGRGEKLSPYPLVLPQGFLLVLAPQIHISTAQAYSGVRLSKPTRELEQILAEPECWRQELQNSFESHIFESHPTLQVFKKRLYQAGAWYASMSGSGACLYGFFSDKPDLGAFQDVEHQLLKV